MDAGDGGLEARHGRTLGGCRWRDAGRGQRLAPLHRNYNCCRCHAPHFEPGKMLRDRRRWAGQFLSVKKQGVAHSLAAILEMLQKLDCMPNILVF